MNMRKDVFWIFFFVPFCFQFRRKMKKKKLEKGENQEMRVSRWGPSARNQARQLIWFMC